MKSFAKTALLVVVVEYAVDDFQQEPTAPARI